MRRNVAVCAILLAMGLGARTYFLTVKGGRICYREPGGAWHDTGLRARSTLPAQDVSLLSRGLHFPSRQALTRALEDFCS